MDEIHSDYVEYCHKKLVEYFGVNYRKGIPNNYDDPYLYHRYKCRVIASKPRIVIERNHFCVPKEFEAAYKEIIKELRSGGNLKRFQSRDLKKVNVDDDMLSHWGIHHLHLNTELEADGFVKRSGQLLFLFLKDDIAYILGVFNHGDWARNELVEVIHQSWPEAIEDLKFNDVRGSNRGDGFSEDETRKLRKAGLTTMITVKDGTSYFGFGMGVTTNGVSSLVTQNLQRVYWSFETYFNLIQANIEVILKQNPKAKEIDTITIGLVMNDELKKIGFVIKETGHTFYLNITD